ncbi:unnamed protein product [Cladocopium goreaui]|uniref:J domain-containing protein n=1 Tax=Cladocopium goreaui TaxID=2562237 RepID=A0A9P1D9D1_9DINO|nr:unnamed protein product [Cladocopium goreaui]
MNPGGEDSGAFCGWGFNDWGFNDWKGKRKGKGKEKGKDGREKGKDKGKKGKGKDGKDFLPPLVDGKGKGGYQEQLRPANFWESWTGQDIEKWKAQRDDVWKSLQLTNPLQSLRSVLKQSQIRYWLVSMRSELKHAAKQRNDRHIKAREAPKAEAPPALKARDAGSGVWTKEALTGKMGQLNSQANWVVHFPPQLLEEGVPVERSISSKLREVQLKLEGLVPTGCSMTIRVNGVETALERKEVQSKRGEAPRGWKQQLTPVAEHSEPSGLHCIGIALESGWKKIGSKFNDPQVILIRWMPEDFEAKHPIEGENASGAKRETAGFEPWICLEGCTLVARTDQQLLVPTIDVVEVTISDLHQITEDSEKISRNLSGETFELTVYASGCAVSAASTLVQKGPVRPVLKRGVEGGWM